MENKNTNRRNGVVVFKVDEKEKTALINWAKENHIGLASSARHLCLKKLKEEGFYKD